MFLKSILIVLVKLLTKENVKTKQNKTERFPYSEKSLNMTNWP